MIGDVMALARGLSGMPADRQCIACQQAFLRTHCADKFRKRLGRLHPRWGDGSLMAFALLTYRGKRHQDLGNRAFLSALHAVLDQLLQWRQIQAARGETARRAGQVSQQQGHPTGPVWRDFEE